MRENGLVTKETVKEYKYGLMEQNMKEIGWIIKLVERVNFIMLMEINIQENGLKIELMDMEFINKVMEQCMKEIGKMIYNMVKVKNVVSL